MDAATQKYAEPQRAERTEGSEDDLYESDLYAEYSEDPWKSESDSDDPHGWEQGPIRGHARFITSDGLSSKYYTESDDD